MESFKSGCPRPRPAGARFPCRFPNKQFSLQTIIHTPNTGLRIMITVTEPEEKQVTNEPQDEQLKIPEVLPVLPLRDIVIFPYMIVPLFVSRDRSLRAVDQALAENRMIMLAAQKDPDKEEPAPGDLYDAGTVAIIMRMLKLPDGRIRILVQGIARAKINYLEDNENFLQARIEEMKEIPPTESLELEALTRNIRSSLEKA